MHTAELTQALQKQGLKLTRSRKAVLEVLATTTEHLKVAEVHRRARAFDPRVGLASVYRTMDLLARLNLVKHIHMEHRHRHYAPLKEHHGHHLVCNSCGLIAEFSDCGTGRGVKSSISPAPSPSTVTREVAKISKFSWLRQQGLAS